jgi:hypothetical protein
LTPENGNELNAAGTIALCQKERLFDIVEFLIDKLAKLGIGPLALSSLQIDRIEISAYHGY